ncbi:MAG: spermidine/putrescine ABC transporter substrate-binding protein [Lachnospiraceae bacterium]|nr:spermidine/putrescine ABC transporter substrate-binding protein [Lachnospiraceae bacterium]MBQ4243191.1 spermidine/putrescine ABC transporter substrate-binding protein [Lachnospiraceae bacterium]MBQ5534428.1 spermidine/putrescine ABC transporter substrate-binding protein [Lachnospiraceae bacterium]
MKRKVLAIAMIISLTLSSIVGCGSAAKADAAGDKGELNLFVWTEYLPDSVVEKFEKETGIKVNVSTYSSNEDMLAKVKSETAGAYDVLQPSDYMVAQLIAQGMLAELDFGELPNFSHIGESYKDPSYDPGNKYSVPYMGGAGAIAVNKAKVNKEIKSYADLFDPSLKDSLVVLDDFRAVIGMTSKSLGYDLSETDPARLKEVSDKLMALKDNVVLYDSDSPKSALISGDCAAGMIWSAEIAMAMEEVPDIEVVYPEEGAYLFFDNWVVTKESPNYESAMKWINFMMEPENMAMVLEEFPYLCANTDAIDIMGEDYSGNPAKNPPADAIAKGSYVQNLDSDTLDIYNEMWTKLKE